MGEPALALRVGPDGLVERLHLPATAENRRDAVRSALGGPLVQGRYHRRLLLHLRDDGAAAGLPLNAVAWAVASVWRGIEISYPLYGPVVVTAYDNDRIFEAVPMDLRLETEQICTVARSVLTAHRPSPMDSTAGTRALLAAVLRSMAAPLN